LARYSACAAEFTYKLSTNVPRARDTSMRLIEAIDKIGRDSGGRLQIDFFPGAQLGSGTETLSQLRLGAIEFSLCADPDLSTVVPVAGVTGLPFIAADDKQALNIVDGAFGTYLRDAVAKVGLYRFPRSWATGFQDIETPLRPINVPADLRGLKLRSSNSRQEIDLLKALGAVPTSIGAAEIYTSLQTHLVDGATLPVSVLESYKVNEVTKYVSSTHHAWGGFTLLANTNAWQRLPKNIQASVARNFENARNLSNSDAEKYNSGAEARLKAAGMIFNNVDAQAFRRVVHDAGLYPRWKTEYPSEAWSLIEKQVGRELS